MTNFNKDCRQGAVRVALQSPRRASCHFFETLRKIVKVPDAAVSKRFLVPPKNKAVTFFETNVPPTHG